MFNKSHFVLKVWPEFKFGGAFRIGKVGVGFETISVAIMLSPLNITVKPTVIGIQSVALDKSWKAFFKRSNTIGLGLLAFTWYI